MTARQVHHVRFFIPPPSAVQSLALCKTSNLLAVSRGNSDIEIWNIPTSMCPQMSPFLQKWIPGNSESSVEGLVWAKGRLFSTGLHGLVLEHDLNTLSTRKQFAVTSGPSWCIDYNERVNRIAVGTEEGYICLFEVTDEGLIYDKVLDKQEGRILCLSWHSSGAYLATGSPDTIRVWELASGAPIARMTTGRTEKRKETIVWSVALLDDMTVMSGDSRGKTCFWNGRLGTQIDAYQTHAADVLTVAVTPSQDRAFSAGVVPTTMHFQPIEKKSGHRKWVTSIHRKSHTHDIRAIVALDDLEVSAGVDSDIVLTNLINKSVMNCPPIPPGDCVVPAMDANLVALRYQKHLEVWKLGQAQENVSGFASGSHLPLQAEPIKLIHLQTKDEETIRSCSISPDGTWLAYATPTRIRVYRIDLQDLPATPGLHRTKVKAVDELQACHHLVFVKAEHGWAIVSATERGDLQIFDLNQSEEKATLVATVSRKSLQLTSSIAKLRSDGFMAFAADFSGHIVAYDTKNLKTISRMPVYAKAPITSLAVNQGTLVATFADRKLIECDIKTGKYTKFTSFADLDQVDPLRSSAVAGVILENDKLILHNLKTVVVLTKARPEGDFRKFKRNEKSMKEAAGSGPRSNWKSFEKYEHLLLFDKLSDDSILAVEVQPQDLAVQLPPSIKQKQFGAM